MMCSSLEASLLKICFFQGLYENQECARTGFFSILYYIETKLRNWKQTQPNCFQALNIVSSVLEFWWEVFNPLSLIHVNLIYFVYSAHIILLIELPPYFDFMYAIGLGYLAFNSLC